MPDCNRASLIPVDNRETPHTIKCFRFLSLECFSIFVSSGLACSRPSLAQAQCDSKMPMVGIKASLIYVQVFLICTWVFANISKTLRVVTDIPRVYDTKQYPPKACCRHSNVFSVYSSSSLSNTTFLLTLLCLSTRIWATLVAVAGVVARQ